MKISSLYNTLHSFTGFYSSGGKNRKNSGENDSRGSFLALNSGWERLKNYTSPLLNPMELP